MGEQPKIIGHRCDKQMRRSKEKCMTQHWKRWKCTGECKSCLCCIIKDENGNEHHIGAMYGSKKLS